MSTGLVLGVVGGVVGAFFGAPQIGYAIGAAVGGAIDYSNQPDTEGPRLQDTKIADSAYGNPIPKVWGGFRVAAQLIWAPPLKEVKKTRSAGKGGGPKIITYTYFFTGAIALAEGPIAGIGKVWLNGEKVFDGRDGMNPENYKDDEETISKYIRLYRGTKDQPRDPRMEAMVKNCSAYRGIAYIVFEDLPLEKYNNRIPNIEVEVLRGPPGDDALPPVRTPKKLFYLNDNGSQAPGLFSVDRRSKKNTMMMFIETDSFGNSVPPKSFAWYYAYTRALSNEVDTDDLELGSGVSENVPSYGDMKFGKNWDPATMPLARKGHEGIQGIQFRSPFGGFAFGRLAEHWGSMKEIHVQSLMPLSVVISPATYAGSPYKDEAIDILMESGLGWFSVPAGKHHLLLTGTGLVLDTDYSTVERDITDLNVSADGKRIYICTRHASEPYRIEERMRVMQDGNPVTITRVYDHPMFGTNIRVCAADDGYLYSCCEAMGELTPGGISVPQYILHRCKLLDPSSEPIPASAWERVCGVVQNFGNAHLGSGGSDFGFRFFFTDGRKAFFNFAVGSGDNSGVGGEGLAGVALRGSSFGANLDTVYVGDIVRELCLSVGLKEDEFDVDELDEPIYGYFNSRRSTVRSIIEPLRTYFPFDVVESDGLIKFRPRGREASATLIEDAVGAKNAG